MYIAAPASENTMVIYELIETSQFVQFGGWKFLSFLSIFDTDYLLLLMNAHLNSNYNHLLALH